MVIMDAFDGLLVVALLTVGFVVVVIVVHVIVVDQCAAAGAEDVIVFVAVTAEGVDVVAFNVCTPDTVKAAVAKGGVLVEAVFAQDLAVELLGGFCGKSCFAELAGVGFAHGLFLQ